MHVRESALTNSKATRTQRSTCRSAGANSDTVALIRSMQRTMGNIAIQRLFSKTSQAVDRDSDELGDYNKAVADPGHPNERGAQKYAAVDRKDWNEFFQTALQGLAGRSGPAKNIADLASAVADECMSFMSGHAAQMLRAMEKAPDEDSKTSLNVALAWASGSTWSESFKSALQTTSGLAFKKASEPVKRAADIADRAVLASGALKPYLWDLYTKSK